MFISISLAAGILASLAAAAKPSTSTLKRLTQQDLDAALAPLPGITFSSPSPSVRSAFDKRAKDRFKQTENWTPLYAYDGPSSGQTSATRTLGRLQRKYGGHGYENITSTSVYGLQYGVEVAFNKQKLMLALDTGSADTWAVGSKSNCTNWFGSCYFGPAYTGGFSGGLIEEEHLFIEYGDGEVIQGPLGYMDVSVAGIHVKNQTVSLANTTLWYGNNITSGILGLAYPSLTNAYGGSFGDEEPYYEYEYAPVFANMVDQGLVDNFFSIAISRNLSDGAIAFGGVPEYLDGVDYDSKAMTDIIIVSRALSNCLVAVPMFVWKNGRNANPFDITTRPTLRTMTIPLPSTPFTPLSQTVGSLTLLPMTRKYLIS